LTITNATRCDDGSLQNGEEEAQCTPVLSPCLSDLSQKWKAMEKRFSDRNRRFRQISDKTQNAELLWLLWDRE
jgi:hypothetical protein